MLQVQKAAKDGRSELANELTAEMEKAGMPVHKGLKAYVARGKVDYLALEQAARSRRPQQKHEEGQSQQ